MTTKSVAEALVRMLDDPKFAAAVMSGDHDVFGKSDLTKQERRSLATQVEEWSIRVPSGVPSVMAWKLVASNIGELDRDTRRELNEAIARHPGLVDWVVITG